MPQGLSIDQIAAPDFSGIGTLMVAGNTSFNNAFDAAHSVLDRYQSGQQGKADAKFLDVIKGATDEKSLTDILAKTDFSNMNLSPDMMKTALGMRDTVLGYAKSRADTENTNANSADTRQGTMIEGVDFRDRIAKLASDRAQSGATATAYATGLQNGQADPATRSGDSSTPEWQAANLTTIKAPNGETWQVNKAAADAFNGFITELNGMGYNTGSSGGYNYRNIRGSNKLSEHADGMAIDINAAANGLGREDGGDMPTNVSEIAAKYGLKWGGDFKGRKDPMHFEYIGTVGGGQAVGGATPGPNGFSGGETNLFMQDPKIQAGIQAAIDNPYKTFSEKQADIDLILKGAQTGQETIKARNDAAQALLAAGTQNRVALDPTLGTDAARSAAILTDPNLNPITAQAASGGLVTATAPGGALAAVAAPPVATDPATDLAAAQARDRAQVAANTDPTMHDIRILNEYAKADDPVKKLLADFNDSKSILIGGVEDSRHVRDIIQKMADEAGVGIPEMTATLRDMTDREALDASFWSPKPTLGGIINHYQTGKNANGWDSADRDPIREAARRYGPGAKLAQTTAQAGSARTQAAIDAQSVKIKSLEGAVAKAVLIDPKDPRIGQWKAEHDALISGMNQVGTKADTIAQKLKLMPANAANLKETAQQLVDAMVAAGPSVYPASQVAAAKAMYGIK